MDGPYNLWKPEYLLDIEAIDEQHKGFFDICIKAAQLCEEAANKPLNPADVIRVLYSLRCYAFKHFHTEETLLLKHNYPRIFEHLSLHDDFLHALKTFTAEMQGCLSRKDKSDAELLACTVHLNDYVAKWWGAHILNQDSLYVEFVRDRRDGL